MNNYAFSRNYSIDTIVKNDSINQKDKLLLSKITYEATDTTAISPKDKLIRFLGEIKKYSGVAVSCHEPDLVDEFIDRTLIIKQKKVYEFEGKPDRGILKTI